MDKITVELVTPEKLVYSEEVFSAVIPGSEGDFGVLFEHAPMISNIRPGIVTIVGDDNKPNKKIFVDGGFVEVTGQRCTILAEKAVDADSLSDSEIEKLIAEAA